MTGDATGADWWDPYSRFESLTPAQTCRANQDMIEPASRVMFCGRCGHAASNAHQGHSWQWCSVLGAMSAGHHFCCPGSCELVDGRDMDPTAPCHPDPDKREEWAAAKDADRANMAVWREMVDGDA